MEYKQLVSLMKEQTNENIHYGIQPIVIGGKFVSESYFSTDLDKLVFSNAHGEILLEEHFSEEDYTHICKLLATEWFDDDESEILIDEDDDDDDEWIENDGDLADTKQMEYYEEET